MSMIGYLYKKLKELSLYDSIELISAKNYNTSTEYNKIFKEQTLDENLTSKEIEEKTKLIYGKYCKS